MFRLLPAWKGRLFSTSLPYVRSNYHWYSTNAICLQIPPNDIEDEKNEIDFELLFSSCTKTDIVKRLHALLIVSGRVQRLSHTTRLVNLYAHLGDVSLSCSTFNQIQTKDTYSWNSMLSAYVRNGQFTEAVNCVYKMLSMSDVRPDFYTFPPVLKACRRLIDGMRLHGWVFKLGFEWDVFVASALVHMYCRFGQFIVANRIFKDMPSRDMGCWNSVISGFCQNGNAAEALAILDQMRLEGIKMDSVTVSSILPVYVVLGNTIVDMYAKLGIMDSARMVFDEMFVKDVVSFNTMIAGYGQNGLASEAVEIFRMMPCKNITPDEGTWVSVLPAYAHLGALREGTKAHGQVFKRGLHWDIFVGTCLVDLYGKCGRLDEALLLFYEVPRTSSVHWNAIIACHGIHGCGGTSLQLFRDMLDEGVQPDHITFLSILAACSHSGLVDQGKSYFHLMQQEYEIKPGMKHYGCMVDLYGRAGHLEKAYNFIKRMPVPPDASVWGALLNACRIHGNIELGKVASHHLFEVDSDNVGYYVLLSNIYANVGRWEGVDVVRSWARDKGLRKTPGWTSIELNNMIEVFYTGHPQSEEMYMELAILTAKAKDLGKHSHKSQ
ncbi:unnamed protein product [Coffea canephora]|uniref:Pentacotripeptide-repeat region of PRORP domain-containing protein n=1 Tax=Coffea canephora TaxID=49390 RepID=A0A068TVT2_COFCA|nr:unnamed protein product [Coffea canephora]